LREGQLAILPLTLPHAEDATCAPRHPNDNKEPAMTNTAIAPAALIRRYFELDADRDVDSIVALFSADATVVDEGETRRGIAEIRAWQVGPASKYTYSTQTLDTVALAADRYEVTGRLTGDFPGGTAALKWDFTVAGGRITRLVIAP
jgi:hypothetical protein